MTKITRIKIRRVYDLPCRDDGFRILVDRLWPRGIDKTSVQIDFWAKELAPTTSLREWFNHEEQKFSEFRLRYLEELAVKQEIAQKILNHSTNKTITLLFAARDRSHNQAVVLQSFLSKI